ncbi:D-alanine--D-alanine ligase family protein [Acetobacter thailandicus]|uniref:Biotin carboxylase n=1 Tax=Acetobacter thailandicus TaxID=1502842 RepID=A0ABT3QCN2_9PROT|nr:biotin carboxylase [Acetobacter thailandicus]MCX2563025.1 biotin carboxylase [Acetobacter thailandicus]NHN96159.1 biotin carboxylase [Acetobacter thailandicus]
MSKDTIAVLFQALPPPIVDGQRKTPKPGGYSDSGADIGFALCNGNLDVITPVSQPDPGRAMDWVFPDTDEGIASAIQNGATVLWANTVLFTGHPIEKVMKQVCIVGQLPSAVQNFDDKFHTNRLLAERGLPAARSFLLGDDNEAEITLSNLTEASLAQRNLIFPLMLKPIRGRGSQGVTRVKSLAALKSQATELLESGEFGTLLILEEYLDGEEVTVTVMPPKSPRPAGIKYAEASNIYWGLRPVCRFNHADGVAPYNGAVAVTQNSRAISAEELAQPEMVATMRACTKAAEIVEARAPIRIDCRAGRDGRYRLFDLNMKPNMTGNGRPGRENQDSLSAIAAEADGWTYLDLLKSILTAAWTE